RLDLDRRAGRPARTLDGAPTFPAGGRTGRLRSPLLERRLHLGTDPDRLGNRGRVVPPADTRLSLADLVRRGPPRQDRAAADGNAARVRQPPPHQAAAG